MIAAAGIALRVAGNLVLAVAFFFAFLLASRRFLIGWESGAQGEAVVWFVISLGFASLVFRALRRIVRARRERHPAGIGGGLPPH